MLAQKLFEASLAALLDHGYVELGLSCIVGLISQSRRLDVCHMVC